MTIEGWSHWLGCPWLDRRLWMNKLANIFVTLAFLFRFFSFSRFDSFQINIKIFIYNLRSGQGNVCDVCDRDFAHVCVESRERVRGKMRVSLRSVPKNVSSSISGFLWFFSFIFYKKIKIWVHNHSIIFGMNQLNISLFTKKREIERGESQWWSDDDGDDTFFFFFFAWLVFAIEGSNEWLYK